MTLRQYFKLNFHNYLLSGILILVGIPVLANTFYVAPSGDDDNSGSEYAPFNTIHKAAEVAKAGNTVLIREGAYAIDREIRFQNAGEENAWIVVQAYPGEKVFIDAYGFTKDQASGEYPSRKGLGAVHVEGAKYLELRDLHIMRARNVGFMVKGKETRHIKLINCSTDGSYGSGIGLWYSQHVEVLGCEIVGANDQDLRVEGQELRREAPHEALTIAGAEHFEVAYNHIHDCVKEGIDCKEVSKHGIIHHNYVHDLPRQGLYVDCWFGMLRDVELHSNVVHDCEWGAVFSAEGKDARMEDIRLHHNLLYNNRGSGILFGIWGNDEPRKQIYIYNNTVYNNGSPNHWAGVTGGIDVRSSSLQDVFIINNITAHNWGFELATFAKPQERATQLTSKNIVISHNLSGKYKSKPQESGSFNPVYGYLGEHAIEGDPFFRNPERGDFRLTRGSPAIGASAQDSPVQTGIDLGAIPYHQPPLYINENFWTY